MHDICNICVLFRSEINNINWRAPEETFPRFTQLLSIEDYMYNTLLGLTVSVGGLTESLVSIYVCVCVCVCLYLCVIVCVCVCVCVH